MFEISAEITIDRPVEDVFAFIADNENDPQWCVPVVETTRIAGSMPGVGARYSFVSQVGSMKIIGEFEITVFKPPEYIEWVSHTSTSRVSGHYRLSSRVEGTYLEEWAKVQLKGVFVLLQPIMRAQFKKSNETQLQRLKQILEVS